MEAWFHHPDSVVALPERNLVAHHEKVDTVDYYYCRVDVDAVAAVVDISGLKIVDVMERCYILLVETVVVDIHVLGCGVVDIAHVAAATGASVMQVEAEHCRYDEPGKDFAPDTGVLGWAPSNPMI
mmetsp:Transcript_1022/g.1859  ORF Transcript_1022/g.1859 Transcript_1022/m.1859 type:complete len:126 (+) Transcript_1022:324-701(+)|eukprot:CAMPEP_0178757766 /NCGR_PEP_ID=MMETSP0744-20121128/13995_1 /TAXON_ID=913974 /ORGANISM="Nitzschia punctata, Strain CCMP561" /LENGTH=125 /DNA_ID=CAMNT_0020412021 /DNA_START=332 /DNA_END=709 /DNA_ORIENTATION=-